MAKSKVKNPTDPQSTMEALTDFLGTVLNPIWDGFLLMLAFGLAHGTAASVPAFGYWECVLFAYVLHCVVGSGTWTIPNRIKRLGTYVQQSTLQRILNNLS